jgi:tetratricopeptide (TPR) repeat protein
VPVDAICPAIWGKIDLMASAETDELEAAMRLAEKKKWDEALPRLQILETSADPDIRDRAMNVIAEVYTSTGQNSDAEAMLRQSIEGRGEDNENRGLQLLELAVVLSRQDRFDEAEAAYAQALDLLRGVDPEMTVFGLRNIAFLYRKMGQLDRAAEIEDNMPECDEDLLGFLTTILKPYQEPLAP